MLIAEVLFYQNVVVLIAMSLRAVAPGVFPYGKLHKMDAMDATTFLDSKESHVNYVNCSM